MNQNEALHNPRVVVVQKLYGNHINKESKITFPKHRYKKFIKDVVVGTIERKELIQNLMDKELKNDINENKTDLIIFLTYFCLNHPLVLYLLNLGLTLFFL